MSSDAYEAGVIPVLEANAAVREWRRGDSTAATFQLHGRAAKIAGTLGAGAEVLQVGRIEITGFAWSRPADHARAGIFTVERRGAGWTECIRVAHDRPLVTVSRKLHEKAPGRTRVRFVLPGPARLMTEEGGLLRFACGAHGDLVVSAATMIWHIEDHGAGLLVVGESSQDSLILTLANVVEGAGSRSVDDWIRHAVRLEGMGAAVLGRLEGDGFVFESPRAVLGRALLRARARLAVALPNVTSARDAAWAVLGALNAGDSAAAREWLHALFDHIQRADCTPADQAWFALAASRHLSWTGDVAAFSAAWPTVRTIVNSLLHPEGRPENPLAIAAIRDSAVAAESTGQAGCAAAWHAVARRARSVDDTDLEERSGPTSAWSLLASGSLAAGCQELCDAATRFETDSRGVADASLAIAAIVGSILGPRPDATRHRLRLRPRLSEDLLPFRAAGLRMGESVFELEARETAEGWALGIEQTGGPVPATVILEAIAPASAVGAVRVDGRLAQLDLRQLGDGWLVPVQLTTDHVRLIEVDGVRWPLRSG